jgi:hypothetical protein
MTLNAWQDRLDNHFQSLQGSAERGTRPIFALEHGLDDVEFAELTAALKDHIRWSQPANGHWLAWIVFAAEVGYKFAGDQYWQTFKEQLTGWDQHEDRYYIRDAFRRFHKNFGGAKPSGAWANNFTIISWPIANAVLPKDLQRHLASVLFETRHLFTKSLIEDPRRLGEVIEAHSIWTSSRFRQFAEEHDLVGRIAVALLSPTDDNVETLLSLPTLKRITADLQREQRSKDQLDDARQRASSVVFRGARTAGSVPGSNRRMDGSDPLEDDDSELDLRRSQYQLELFLSQTGEDRWSLRATLPDFASLIQARPQFAQVFSNQRSFIDGAERPFFPPKFLLCGRRPVTLTSLPGGTHPFVRFEEQSPETTAFLESICHFPTFKTMLFRLTDDGLAVRVRSTSLKPGSQYILLQSDATPASIGLQGAHITSVSCTGISAVQIDVPDFVSQFFQDEAEKLGLDVTNGLSVAPAIYPPMKWDEEGSVEWAEGSPMLLNLKSDFEMSDISLVLFGCGVDTSMKILSPNSLGTIIDLEAIVEGVYQLHIAARLPSGREVRTGSLDIQVSSTHESSLISPAEPTFAVLSSPPVPTMEELWNGVATLDVYGSAGLQLDCKFRFYADADKRHCLLECPSPRIAVPLLADDWEKRLNDLKRQPKVSNAFDAAALCSIVFRSHGLGSVELDCEREFIPFRIKAKHSSSAYKLRLIQNDTTDAVSIDRISFTAPGKLIRILDTAGSEFNADPSGGLYAARRNDIVSAIVIPPIRITSLSDIQLAANRLPAMTMADQLSQVASSIRLWTEAQSIGDILSTQRRGAALLSLRTCFIESVCGAPWVALEENVSQGRDDLGFLAAKLGNNQYCSIIRTAIAGSSEFLEQSPEQLIGSAVQLFRQQSPTIASENDSQGLTLILAYLQISRPQTEPLPTLPEPCSAFALSQPWLMRVLRFAIFAKERLVKLEADRSYLETR